MGEVRGARTGSGWPRPSRYPRGRPSPEARQVTGRTRHRCPYRESVMVKRPPAGSIPDAPGSYQFKDAHGRVIYVGKASSLRQRLSNYFQAPHNLHPRTRQMVETAESVEWTTVRNEVEALMLEYSLIKQHQPRFNVRLQGRQVVSVPGGHRRRPMAAGAGDARSQAQGHSLLRSVRPRLRDSRHARPAAAQLPDPHLQPGQVQPARAARSPVPAVPHREVLRTRASARSRRCRTASSCASCATSSPATPTTSSTGSKRR